MAYEIYPSRSYQGRMPGGGPIVLFTAALALTMWGAASCGGDTGDVGGSIDGGSSATSAGTSGGSGSNTAGGSSGASGGSNTAGGSSGASGGATGASSGGVTDGSSGGATDGSSGGSTGSMTGGSNGSVSDGGAMCGGFAGFSCDGALYCDYPQNTCGSADESGVCRARPQVCTQDCPGVCGCDGKFYCNACLAHQAGVDDTGDTSCMRAPDAGGAGSSCTNDQQCGAGLKCCYPCGTSGCTNRCVQPDSAGRCPLVP